MRKLICSLAMVACLLSGCLKSNDEKCNYTDSTLVAPANEVQQVQTYVTTNSITATQHPTGFFYAITSQGNGKAITNLCSAVSVKYSGKLTNGTVFDSTGNSAATFRLGQVIAGWQKGVPLISNGGKINLYIPPTLGYGNKDVKNNAGVIVIPANSVLVFSIELIDVG